MSLAETFIFVCVCVACVLMNMRWVLEVFVPQHGW